MIFFYEVTGSSPKHKGWNQSHKRRNPWISGFFSLYTSIISPYFNYSKFLIEAMAIFCMPSQAPCLCAYTGINTVEAGSFPKNQTFFPLLFAHGWVLNIWYWIWTISNILALNTKVVHFFSSIYILELHININIGICVSVCCNIL